METARARFLRDRVLTATPAQRVVMLYDRLGLDLTQAATSEDALAAGTHIGHASQVVAELLGSLDTSAGGPADNLAAIYGYLLRELTAIRISGARQQLPGLAAIVAKLRAAWAAVAEAGVTPDAPRGGTALAGAWVG